MTYEEQLLDPRWKEKRAEILALFQHKCQECDTDSGLQVHHKTYDLTKMAWEYENDNFMCLCSHHHKMKHLPTCCEMEVYSVFYDADTRQDYMLKASPSFCFSCGRPIKAV